MRVTCLCLTRNRRNWLPQAIQCFLNQTYQDRELLIVSDGEPVMDLIPSVPGLIRHVIVQDETLIGTKRNIGCDLASGEVIAHWDDDDYSAPERLERQVPRLDLFSVAVTGYRSLPFTDGKNWWQYLGMRDYALDSSLVYRRAYWAQHPFQDLQVGFDTLWVHQVANQKQLASFDDEGMMAISIHPGNTSPRTISPRSSSWKQIEAPRIAESMQEVWACCV